MRQMTIDDFKNLKHGDKVYRCADGNSRGLRFVGLMPGCENYFIFSDGEYLTYFYINHSLSNWHTGEYSSEYIGQRLKEYTEGRLASINEVYFKKGNE